MSWDSSLNVYLLKLFIFIIHFVTISTCNVSVPMLGVIMTKKIQISTTTNDFLSQKSQRLVAEKRWILRSFKTLWCKQGGTRADGLMPQNGVGRTAPIFLRSPLSFWLEAAADLGHKVLRSGDALWAKRTCRTCACAREKGI